MAGGGGANRSGGGRLTEEDIRQFAREFSERRGDATDLRRDLAQQGYDVADLDRLIAQMAQLENQRTFGDLERVGQLQSQVIEGLKAFEYALRRQIEGSTKEKLFLGGNDDVPPAYRQMVEEFYKRLSTTKPPPKK